MPIREIYLLLWSGEAALSRIFGIGRYVIHVWPNDHRPIHCRVTVGDGESEYRVFVPSFEVEYVSGKPLRSAELKEIIGLVRDQKNLIGKELRRLHGN